MSWKNDQVTEGETAKILEIARECLALSGDFVEMGCYKGDTSLTLAEVLRDGMDVLSAYVSSGNRGGVRC